MEYAITEAIIDWQNGAPKAKEKFELVIYDHLRTLASNEKHKMEKKHGAQSIQEHVQSTTSLVHDVYIKIQQGSKEYLTSRKDFALLVAKTVHNILVDHARKSSTMKRQGKVVQLDSSECECIATNNNDDALLDLTHALTAMERQFPRQAQSMQLKYFGGLLVKEIADVLNISISSAEKDIAFAKSWLKLKLS